MKATKHTRPHSYAAIQLNWALVSVLWLGCLAAACGPQASGQERKRDAGSKRAERQTKPNGAASKLATFAGGCFWCVEPPFDKTPGVLETTVGYTGGNEKNPTYRQVSAGLTGHLEAIQVRYDPKKVSYAKLLDVFWHNVDPTDEGGQFVDRGKQYRTAIFYHDKSQKMAAWNSRKKLEKSGVFSEAIYTRIRAAKTFYPAEEYHQNYYKKSPDNYYRYRRGSGRDAFIQKTWGSKVSFL